MSFNKMKDVVHYLSESLRLVGAEVSKREGHYKGMTDSWQESGRGIQYEEVTRDLRAVKADLEGILEDTSELVEDV